MPPYVKTVATLAGWNAIPLRQRSRWYIPEQVTNAVPIMETNDPLVDVIERAEHERLPMVFAPVAPKDTRHCYLRRDAASRLMNAARALKEYSQGALALKITDAFRPLELQRKYFKEISRDIAAREGLSGKELWKRTTQFVADPDGYPPHTTGGAVDCTIVVRKSGKELPMGTAIDTVDDRSNFWHPAIRGAERQNRQLLFRMMTTAGFVNAATEWWHYSFGDQYWAAFLGKPQAIYGMAESLPDLRKA
ncbi:MAG: hypothetical protein A3B37_02240 [Candidatus Sungbacteria bacterium RIFCSPLOWO2_01_FULL_59_16]|uniref:D-alanyl-D-alanine dipeptidase n=1 Tax=Candidatus Sungbacteria bacterium RIFCSPLOWO2_01_FULL_59_16 TaxID=1802280 RepID=A0A1G2LEV1_9BACT|nr:MAG: hypothetical protein A3B37_02240 [Candidatus Sungbacteria bacterium RIFCSPLOWO2_01_FULL_59_16]